MPHQLWKISARFAQGFGDHSRKKKLNSCIPPARARFKVQDRTRGSFFHDLLLRPFVLSDGNHYHWPRLPSSDFPDENEAIRFRNSIVLVRHKVCIKLNSHHSRYFVEDWTANTLMKLYVVRLIVFEIWLASWKIANFLKFRLLTSHNWTKYWPILQAHYQSRILVGGNPLLSSTSLSFKTRGGIQTVAFWAFCEMS